MVKKIFEATLIMGFSSILVMGIEMIRIKVIAIYLGPEGVGTLSVLNQFHTVAVTVIGLGLGAGIVKSVSTYNFEGKELAVKKILYSAFQIIFLAAMTVCFITIVFSSYLSGWILGDPDFSDFIVVYAVSLPLAVYPITTSSFLQGLKRVNSLAKINILKSIISIMFIVPMIYFFRLEGAVFSVVITTVVHFFLNKYYIRGEKKDYRAIRWQLFDPGLTNRLLPYGMATLLTGATYSLSHLLLKIIIVSELGMEMNGIYQPVWALTMTYLAIVLSSMTTYSYPRLCELNSDNKIVQEVNGMLRVAVLVIMPVMFLLIFARQPIIQILYSSNFLDAAEYMPIQILGDFFKILTWLAGAFLLPTNRIKAFICLGVLTDALLVLFAVIFVKTFQLHGVTVSFALTYLISFVAHYWYAKNQIGLSLWNKNRKLILFSFGALVAIIISSVYLSIALSLVADFLIIAMWGLLSVEKQEIIQLKKYLSEKLKNLLIISNSEIEKP